MGSQARAFYSIQRLILLLFLIAFSGSAAGWLRGAGASSSLQGNQKIDPAAWGSDHAGKPVPEFVHGDECLFCHRNDIGPGWQKNAHGIGLRESEDAPDFAALAKASGAPRSAAEASYFMGSRHRVRLLKKSGYGKFALLSAQAALRPDHKLQKWIDADNARWDATKFGDRCAGCHTTGVDSTTKQFTGFGLDCYTCHGVVDLDHTKDTSLIWLSKKRKKDTLAITSICASCHLREAKSRSTGLPYPNNFVVGDNLFKDLNVDFSKADDQSLNAGDRHIYRTVRDIVVNGADVPSCITCHQVHANTSAKHKLPPRSTICLDCHNAEGPLKISKPYTVSSAVCEY